MSFTEAAVGNILLMAALKALKYSENITASLDNMQKITASVTGK